MSNKLLRALPLVALAGVLAGCGQHSNHSGAATMAPSPGTVLVTVNGEPITTSDVDALIQLRSRGRPVHLNAQQRYQQAKGMIQLVLAAQAAEKAGIAKTPAMQTQLKLERNMILASKFLQNYIANAKVSESTLRQRYEQIAKAQSGEEYKARHILVKTKDKAEHIIQMLNKGADFATLAKKYSIGPSGKKGGELGWFKPQTMVPPFSAAVEKLQPGHYTKEPVKSQFGWHVILLEKEKQATPPSYTSMKPMLMQNAKRHMVPAYLRKLQSSAKIDWKVPNPASAAAAAHKSGGSAEKPVPTPKPATH